ncbi:response regulator [Kineococcus radiotolerans]|uniref:Two component transcriptional regulator, LuxR family n=1 Tax=Kineococcus radiotolerans (strain ATCC BAA-149 / DSM 14245 / SRS30216) TaxID=266940 RepID=A6WB23_KINRD|nr:response regulator transcription factor [Kineococcus radiotolerans]ABS04012.1 two component transcriptional regulator, LuxR family [Kineococcus radiotolerans SRS30216 = ATCC BAA-149]
MTGSATALRVLVVDDQPLARSGITGILAGAAQVQVVGEAADGQQALELMEELEPDVVLLDLRMPVLGGVEVLRRLRAQERFAAVRVVVLTTFDGDDEVVQAMAAGADGFLSKASDPDDILQAITSVASGDIALSQRALRAVVAGLPTPTPADDRAQRTGAGGEGAVEVARLRARVELLTARERDVVVAVARGLDNTQIGEELFISPLTVKTHVSRAMTKLRVRDRAQLVAIAYRAGIANPPR